VSEYNKKFPYREGALVIIGETDEWRHLRRAENLLDVAEERAEYVIWTLSPEGQECHAEHSQQ